ncbi:MAG: MFS transporter [Clostridia bacterium]|nr:MFS transporter [Clostridia bacterium]
MSNIKKYCIFTTIYNVGYTFCTGIIMQTFLNQVGFSEEQVYVLNSVMQIMQVAVMLVLTFLSGKIKRVKTVTSISYLSLSLLAVVFLLGAINPELIKNGYVIAVFIVAGISYVGVGLHNIISYCLPYHTIDMKEYGKMIGISTAIAGGTSFLMSSVYSILVTKFSHMYMRITAAFFVLAIVCFIVASIVCASMREKAVETTPEDEKKDDIGAVFKNKNTYLLLIPNFVRGLAVGIFSVIVTIAISTNLLNETTSSYVNVILQIATFAANMFFAFTCKKMSTKNVLLIATIGVCVSFPLSLEFGTIGFFCCFAIASFFRLVTDTAIPVIITEIIPKEQIGPYTSIRMLVFTGAQAVATLLITPLKNVVGYTGVLIFATVMLFICCVTYYAVAKSVKRNSQSANKID